MERFDHYIALDWSKVNMAIARVSAHMREPKVTDTDSDLNALKHYLSSLRGRKILTVEETTTAHWLYTELKEYVDRIIVCDPLRNKLLSEGPKTDKIDARKLCLLLRGGFLKEVYHTTEKRWELRKYVSAYQDLIKMGVRVQNQRTALYQSHGMPKSNSSENLPKTFRFIDEQMERHVALYEEHRLAYQKLFSRWCRQERSLKCLLDVPGIAEVSAVKILATVIDAKRFRHKGHYLSYCGLVKHYRLSGRKNYGQKDTRYSRLLKEVYKTAAMAAINGQNPIREYYDYLLQKGIAEHNARHAVARYIAVITYGMLKSGEKYQPYRWREKRKP
jgi:transposase